MIKNGVSGKKKPISCMRLFAREQQSLNPTVAFLWIDSIVGIH